MAIITLTTDFGLKDHYVAAVKGAIYTEEPNSTIVDISHLAAPFNYAETAYIVKHAYTAFPEGSIHIIGVDSEWSTENQHIVMKLNQHYFIGSNNGVLSMLCGAQQPDKLVEINVYNATNDNFPVKNCFTKIACHIARGGSLDVIGKPFNQLKEVSLLTPVINTQENLLVGSVQYIDNYGNVITNITQDIIEQYRKGRNFEIEVRNLVLKEVYNRYKEFINYTLEHHKRQEDGKCMAVFNSNGYLEIAIYKSNLATVGGAATLLGLEYRDNVSIKFLD